MVLKKLNTMNCYPPLDQQLRMVNWEICRAKEVIAQANNTIAYGKYLQMEVGVHPNVVVGGTTISLAGYNIKSDTIRVALDGTALMRDRNDRITYATPIYGTTNIVLHFNQFFNLGQIYVIEFTYYNT